MFSSCTKYNTEICYSVNRPEGVIRDTIKYETFDSKCNLTYDQYNGYYVLKLEDNINIRNLLVSKYTIVIESFHKEKIIE